MSLEAAFGAICDELRTWNVGDRQELGDLKTLWQLQITERRMRLAERKENPAAKEQRLLSPEEMQDRIWRQFGMNPEQREIRREQIRAEREAERRNLAARESAPEKSM